MPAEQDKNAEGVLLYCTGLYVNLTYSSVCCQIRYKAQSPRNCGHWSPDRSTQVSL